MKPTLKKLPRLSFGIYPTPFHKLEQISEKYGRTIWMKRDDLCGVALGGSKVRKLEYLLAEAWSQGCDVVFTTDAQTNHAILTAACTAQMDMKTVLLLKDRGTSNPVGSQVLNQIYGADVHRIDTDRYEDIYAEMFRLGNELEVQGHRCYFMPMGGFVPLGCAGYVQCARELSEQAVGIPLRHIVCSVGSGGTAAGLLLGCRLFLPDVQLTGIDLSDEPFESIVPSMAEETAELLEVPLERTNGDFRILHHRNSGAVPDPADLPYLEELARLEGILLDPVYPGKAWSGMMRALLSGAFDGKDDIVFIHTGGAAALSAPDMPHKEEEQ